MKNYNKIFKIVMWALVAISVVLLVWGFLTGFEANDGRGVEVLLYWAYIILAIAILAVVVFGLIISAKNDPKSLVKIGIVILGVAVLCFIAFLLAKGNPAMAYNGPEVSAGTLKLTDTILNLTYIVGGAAILAIIVGEVRMAIASKK